MIFDISMGFLLVVVLFLLFTIQQTDIEFFSFVGEIIAAFSVHVSDDPDQQRCRINDKYVPESRILNSEMN